MPNNSNRTSNLGPRVSHVTTKAYSGPGHYLVPSWMTFEVGGPMTATSSATFGGTVTLSSEVIFSNFTTASLTSATLTDRELSVGSVGPVSAYLFYRSGNTVYEWLSESTSI